MDKEYREMKIAHYKYESLLEKIKGLQSEIENINDLLKQYENIESKYTTLFNAKILWANQNGFGMIENYEREIRNIVFHIKEIDEAILANKKLLLSLNSAKGDLASILSINTEKVLDEALIPEMVKRDQLKSASQYISDSIEKSEHLMRELKDLKPYLDVNLLEAMSIKESFDVYFDKMFMQININAQLDDAYRYITLKFEAAKQLLSTLENMRKSCESQIEDITKKRNEMILSL